MDIKIKGNRLKNLLSYDWLKIIVAIAAGIAVWSLLFTTLSTRVTVGEEFVFNVYENVYSRDESKNTDILKDLKDKGQLSYDVLNMKSERIAGAGQYNASYMLSLKVSVQEGDVMIISDGRAGKMQDDVDPTLEIKRVVNAGYLYDIEKLLLDASDYCIDNGFVSVKDGHVTYNEETIKQYFLTKRLKSAGNYRKTFRTEAQKNEGVALEIKRIKALYENYLYVSQAILKAQVLGCDFLWYGELNKYDSEGNIIEGEGEIAPYGIDLYKLNQSLTEEDAPRVKDTWYTYADGKTTDEGLVACVFNFRGYQPDMQYETLAFLRYLIETYSVY